MQEQQYHVQVLMSAYNGEKHISRQIESILNQQNVLTTLLIRDDGSSDHTYRIIEEYSKKYPDRIQILSGTNIGYRKSFLSLFSHLEEADYYAYADQDDIWKPDKVISAIKCLLNNTRCWLYASALTNTDEHGNVISEKKYEGIKLNLASFFVRTRLAGCTFLFVPELAEIAKKYSDISLENEEMPDHDCLLCMLCSLHGHFIYVDDHSYIYHIRYKNSETAGKGIAKRLIVENKRIFSRKHCYQKTSELLIRNEKELWDTESNNLTNYLLLCEIRDYNKNIKNKLKLLFDNNLSCGIKAADMLIRIKIIFNIY